ncbi:hypothetical protein GEV43_45385 [Actinomadura sp. J1-007]|uniref:sensor histidine kinase n=1 Tax=Actinomadura sp. J1-007 TaxID=2661913 RepID=UPI001326C088|nr:histidine kinase [Actinomadura sp. J1-007]MWK40477.1 hypothetical protein [Actinomadura sp. J1-007]
MEPEARPRHRDGPARRARRALAAVRRRWSPSARSRALDGLVVLLALLVVANDVLQHGPREELVIGLPLGIVQAGALMLRRSRPVGVLALVAGTDAFGWLLLPGLWFSPASLASVFALYALGKYRPYATGWVAGAGQLVLAAACYLLRTTPADKVSNVVLCALTVVLGQYVRLRREMTERRRAARAHEAVQAERRRIARELHDVVAHHISVMNVLVGAARTTMRLDPERAEEALTTTERTAREAMAEMRQLLAVLRADDRVEDPEPGARTSRLPELVERARAAGVRRS